MPWLSVHDPIDEGDPLEPDDEAAIFAGLFLHHVANIISALGHEELAASLRDLTSERPAALPVPPSLSNHQKTCVSSSSHIPPQSVEYTLNVCPVFRGHLSCTVLGGKPR